MIQMQHDSLMLMGCLCSCNLLPCCGLTHTKAYCNYAKLTVTHKHTSKNDTEKYEVGHKTELITETGASVGPKQQMS